MIWTIPATTTRMYRIFSCFPFKRHPGYWREPVSPTLRAVPRRSCQRRPPSPSSASSDTAPGFWTLPRASGLPGVGTFGIIKPQGDFPTPARAWSRLRCMAEPWPRRRLLHPRQGATPVGTQGWGLHTPSQELVSPRAGFRREGSGRGQKRVREGTAERQEVGVRCPSWGQGSEGQTVAPLLPPRAQSSSPRGRHGPGRGLGFVSTVAQQLSLLNCVFV